MTDAPGEGGAVPISCPLCGEVARLGTEASRVGGLWRCLECALVFSWPREVLPDLYDEAYSGVGEYGYYFPIGEQAAMGDIKLPWPQRTFLRRVRARGSLLDIGCSTGRFLAGAAKAGWDVAGVEKSAAAARIAERIAPAAVAVGTLEDVPGDHRFDAITAWEVLEHLHDPVKAVEKTAELLRDGGYLGVSVPNWTSPWTRQSTDPEHWPPYHLTFWTRESLERLLRQGGYEVLTLAEKPFAWGEEVGRKKWVQLPISLLRACVLGQKGMHILAIARKPGTSRGL